MTNEPMNAVPSRSFVKKRRGAKRLAWDCFFQSGNALLLIAATLIPIIFFMAGQGIYSMLYFAANDEWSMIAFGTEPVTNEGYPNGAAIVKTEELKTAMEEVNNDDSTDNGNSEDSYVTEDIATIKAAIEAAGLIYDESAFEGEDLTSYPNLIAYTDDLRKNGTMAEADVYGYLLNNLPIGMDDEQIIPAFTEFMKPYVGKSFMIEIVSDAGRNYDFNVYIK